MRNIPSRFACANRTCVAFESPRDMYLVLPVPLSERTLTAKEIRLGVRCASCFARMYPKQKQSREVERFMARTGTVADALGNTVLATALLSGDPMQPPIGGAP